MLTDAPATHFARHMAECSTMEAIGMRSPCAADAAGRLLPNEGRILAQRASFAHPMNGPSALATGPQERLNPCQKVLAKVLDLNKASRECYVQRLCYFYGGIFSNIRPADPGRLNLN